MKDVMTPKSALGSKRARVIAFYLPQFHPTAQNDEFWGKGFTEWRNVAQARPLFRKHVQPQLPGELGFYDLRLDETRVQQAALAEEYGVESFCYWHYWFGNGKRILERPFDEVLKSGRPDFPFCLAWANQSWTGIWHGSPGKILIEQTYPGLDDYDRHYAALAPAFKDPRYTTIDGKPLFLVYQPAQLPDSQLLIERWNVLAQRDGLPGIHFLAMSNQLLLPSLEFFDGIVMYGPADYVINQSRLRRALSHDLGPKLDRSIRYALGPARYSYRDVAMRSLDIIPPDSRYHPCILPNWDNTPRSGRRGIVFTGATPELFSSLLENAILRVETREPQQRLVFLKAWNEWAEGNYVEPDVRYGRARLEVIRDRVLQVTI